MCSVFKVVASRNWLRQKFRCENQPLGSWQCSSDALDCHAMPSFQVLVASTSRRVPLSSGCQFLRDEEVDLFLQGYPNEHWSHRVPKQSRGTKFVCFGVSQAEQNRTETSKGKHNFQKSQKIIVRRCSVLLNHFIPDNVAQHRKAKFQSNLRKRQDQCVTKFETRAVTFSADLRVSSDVRRAIALRANPGLEQMKVGVRIPYDSIPHCKIFLWISESFSSQFWFAKKNVDLRISFAGRPSRGWTGRSSNTSFTVQFLTKNFEALWSILKLKKALHSNS